jgi:hypothetical protein
VQTAQNALFRLGQWCWLRCASQYCGLSPVLRPRRARTGGGRAGRLPSSCGSLSPSEQVWARDTLPPPRRPTPLSPLYGKQTGP